MTTIKRIRVQPLLSTGLAIAAKIICNDKEVTSSAVIPWKKGYMFSKN